MEQKTSKKLTVSEYYDSDYNMPKITKQAINKRIRNNQPLNKVVKVSQSELGKMKINYLHIASD